MNVRTRKSSSRSNAAIAGVDYVVELADPKGHYVEVTCVVARPAAEGQRLALPAWIPGSYMIRDFARNIVEIRATGDGRDIALVKLDKDTWQAASCPGPLVVTYRVYAWDPSVRAAHLDETHAFLNGTSIFLQVAGFEHEAHRVSLKQPGGATFRAWRVATTLPSLDVAKSGFGRYLAADYDELIDHPIEMGTFHLERFDAAGVPHEIAYTGVVPNLDAARVNADLATICAAQIRFFATPKERKTNEGAPFRRYLFLTNVVTDGYGGLEHRASTALICSRDALPVKGSTERSRGYRTFLGLASHEYFHSWNVKRIKPALFAPYALDRETHTELLWIFEGFTSYYDDLFLVRTGLITETQYLEEVAGNIDHVLNGFGHTRQSVAESSFDAWTKYYRTDENTPNAVVSYYKKGALIALCLDLFIRRASSGKASLDDVMHLLWKRYGSDFYEGAGQGLPEDGFPDVVEEATGVDARREIRAWAYGTEALPIEGLIADCGLRLLRKPRGPAASLGVRTSGDDRECRITHVSEGGPAYDAGLAAGDVLTAIDALRVTGTRLDALLSKYRPGAVVTAHAFRGDVLQTRRVKLGASPLVTTIADRKKVGKAAARARSAWLGA